jgi:hypothetical protein
MILHDTDHYGYYICGTKKFYNKFQAILYAKSNNCAVNFYFNDDIFGRYDWKVEPSESLDELYTRRALELRSQYDYLVLHFSGGYDSGNILETFAKNNIHIDEIYIRGSTSTSVTNANITSSSNQYAEVELTAIPLAEHVKATYMPYVKITVQDTVPYIIDTWSKNTKWIDDMDISDFSPSTIIKKMYDDLNPRYKKLTEAGKSVGHIMGMEKPDIYYQDGEYYTRFLDKFSLLHTPHRNNELPMHLEPFYWAPSCAEMIIKQCHVIKKYIKQQNLDPLLISQLRGTAKHHWLGNIIYNRSFPMLFYADKGITEIRETDYFFFKDKASDYYINWKKGIDYIRDSLPNEWVHDSVSKGIVGIYSKSYCVGG